LSLPNLKQAFVTDSIQTPIGSVPQVSSSLVWADRLGTYKARWGIGRMDYTIEPGLYALGNPNEQSAVLVTANYKMSFDKLRETLPGRNMWILVLDTKGINVWCSAGKGTFGTMELVHRIQSTGLAKVVSHRELILPQLAGPGVAAHEVKRLSGFKVIYGPIRSKDLPTFLENGFKATPEMRLKTFTARERIALIPIELVSAMKVGVVVLPMLFFIAFLGRTGEGWTNAFHHGLFSVAAIMTAILTGSVFTPLLLPWLPGRAFSVKGLSLGILSVLILLVFGWGDWITWANRLERLAWIFILPAASAFLAMNFTGASTYTSLSGVRKEMRWAVPLQISACIMGFGLWLASLLLPEGL
jgi:acetyl-CoA decarbonylase/synthase complex subunit gamma